MRRDARQHIAEPGTRLDAVPLLRRDETRQHSRGLAAFVAAEQRPVATADGDVAIGPLGRPVVDLQIAVFEETRERVSLAQRIAHRPRCGTLRENFLANLEQVSVQFAHHRSRHALA